VLRGQCTLTLSGKIIDRHSKDELSEAEILLLPDSTKMLTDAHGEFEFRNLCPGEKRIIIRHSVCKDTVIRFSLTEKRKLKIYLNHYYNELNEISIEQKKPDYHYLNVTEELSKEKMDEVRGGSFGEQLKKIPGVSLLQTGPTISKPMIHGMHGYRVLIVNNGIRHEAQQWGSEHAPEVDPFVYDKTEVIKGTGTIRYGSDAVAGVVASSSSPLPDTAGVFGEVFSVGHSNGRSGQVSGKIQGKFNFLNGLSWRFQGSLKQSGDRHAPQYFITNTGVREWNGAYQLQYRYKNTLLHAFYTQFNSLLGIYTGAHIGNLTDLNNILQNNTSPYSSGKFSYDIQRPMQKISHELIKIALKQNIGTIWSVNAHYAFQYNIRSEFDKHRSFNNKTSDLPELDYRVQTQQAEITVEHLLIKGFKGQTGLQFLHQINNSFGRFFIPNYLRYDGGIFLTETYSIPHWKFEAGLRYDYRHIQSYFYKNNELFEPLKRFDRLSFQTSAFYMPTNSLTFMLQFGNAWRAPAPNELYSNGLHHGVGGFEKGNPDLKKESGLNGNAYLEWNSELLYIRAGYFLHDFSNFIYLQPTGNVVLSIQGAFPEFEYRQSAVCIQGVELTYVYKIKPFLEFQQSFSMVRGNHKNTGKYLIYMPSDRLFTGLKFFLLRSRNEAWAEIQHQWVDRQVRVEKNEDFAPPPAGYHVFNFLTSFRLKNSKKFQDLMLMIEIQNIFNVTYRDFLDRYRYFTDAPGRNVICRIKIPFYLMSKK
jgi:iron complex outermembrane receptor protein